MDGNASSAFSGSGVLTRFTRAKCAAAAWRKFLAPALSTSTNGCDLRGGIAYHHVLTDTPFGYVLRRATARALHQEA